MISGSKPSFAGSAGMAAASAAGASTVIVACTASSAISRMLHGECLFLGEHLDIGVVVQLDRLGRTFAGADATALARRSLDRGLLGVGIDDRHAVGTDPHAGETGGAL